MVCAGHIGAADPSCAAGTRGTRGFQACGALVLGSHDFARILGLTGDG